MNKKCKYQQECGRQTSKYFNWYSLKAELKKAFLKKLFDLFIHSVTNLFFFLQGNNSGHRILISLNNNKEPKQNTLKENYHYYKIFYLDCNYTTPL